MTYSIDPCAGISTKIKLPTFECTDSILPHFGNITDFGRGIGSLPIQLEKIAACQVGSVAAKIRAAIQNIKNTLDTLFGSYPFSASTPLFKSLHDYETEFDIKIRALFVEFKMYIQMKIIDIITSIIPLDWLNIPLPFISGATVGDLLTTDGRAKIRALVAQQIDKIYSALGLPWNITFTGDLGLDNLELRVQHALTKIYSDVCKNLTNIIHSLFGSLISQFNKIWNSLGLPALPILSFPDFSTLISNTWNSIKNLAISIEEKLTRTITAILNFDLSAFLGSFSIAWPFKTKIGDLLGLSGLDFKLHSPEMDFSRIMIAAEHLMNSIMMLVLEIWMDLVKSFFNAIGLGALLQYIPFTFCTFINLVASPLLGLGAVLQGILPKEITV